MKKNKPNIDEKVGMGIARSISLISKRYDLDWRLLSAIVMQESGYKIDACRNKKRGEAKCTDYGLAQIHIANVNALNLNKQRLLVDPKYNLNEAGKILKNFKDRFGKKRTWWMHYHGGNEISKKEMEYKKLVLRYY